MTFTDMIEYGSALAGILPSVDGLCKQHSSKARLFQKSRNKSCELILAFRREFQLSSQTLPYDMKTTNTDVLHINT